MDPTIVVTILSALQDKTTREVFGRVFKGKSVRMGELIHSEEERPAVEGALQVLEDKQLVKVKPSSLPDYNSYVITADGLAIARQMGLPA